MTDTHDTPLRLGKERKRMLEAVEWRARDRAMAAVAVRVRTKSVKEYDDCLDCSARLFA